MQRMHFILDVEYYLDLMHRAKILIRNQARGKSDLKEHGISNAVFGASENFIVVIPRRR